MMARLLNIIDVTGVTLIANAAIGLGLHQLGEADDGIQRRAQFVADIGKKLALRPVGSARFVERCGKHFTVGFDLLGHPVEVETQG